MSDPGKRREAANVALDRDDFLRTFREQCPREPAGAGTNFDNRRIGQRRGGARDAARKIEIEKKILAERFFGQKSMRGGDLAQRRQTVELVASDRSRPGFSHVQDYRANSRMDLTVMTRELGQGARGAQV